MFSRQIEELKESYQEKLENTFEMYKDAIKEHAYQSAMSNLEDDYVPFDEFLAEQQKVEVCRVQFLLRVRPEDPFSLKPAVLSRGLPLLATTVTTLIQLFLLVTSGITRRCLALKTLFKSTLLLGNITSALQALKRKVSELETAVEVGGVSSPQTMDQSCQTEPSKAPPEGWRRILNAHRPCFSCVHQLKAVPVFLFFFPQLMIAINVFTKKSVPWRGCARTNKR